VSGTDFGPFRPILDSRGPVITAVNCIFQAVGLLIAMLSDICVASDRATFRVPELLRGIPDATYAAVLPAHVGIAVARDLLLSARKFDAAEAQRLGVISRVVPHDQLREAAITAAKEVLQTPPRSVMHVKRMLNELYGFIDYQTRFWALEESPEPREGMRAFMEKRSPSWVPEEFSKGNGRLLDGRQDVIPNGTAGRRTGPRPPAPGPEDFAYSATTFLSDIALLSIREVCEVQPAGRITPEATAGRRPGGGRGRGELDSVGAGSAERLADLRDHVPGGLEDLSPREVDYPVARRAQLPVSLELSS
jgi:hypothetical protein